MPPVFVRTLCWAAVFLLSGPYGWASTFFLDASAGSDEAVGTSPDSAWKTLTQANDAPFSPGDRLLLKRGETFKGSLVLRRVKATAESPVLVGSYGDGPLPVIDARGVLAGVEIINGRGLVIENLEIFADGGEPRDGSDPTRRYGVFVRTTNGGSGGHLILRGLTVRDIFPFAPTVADGHRKTSHYGTAIAIHGGDATFTNVLVEDCRIERTGFKAIELRRVSGAQVLHNRMKDIGGPAIQPGRVQDLVVRGNVVDGSGSSVDPRMHGRGSGIWPWTSERVLIERNAFMHARGPADSCGVHIDFNCRDVVVQYNLSYDNEGGFIEILGNCHNSAYRYNLSVNDGARVKGRNGAFQEGKIIWTSGYVGRDQPKTGPFNSYLYNNTIYVAGNRRACFSIAPTTEGLLIANNIFHLQGPTESVLGDQDGRKDATVESIPRVDVRHNLYLHASVLPPGLPFEDLAPLVGDAGFAHPGGTALPDYIPRNAEAIRDRGIVIPKLAGDDLGLRIGLKVEQDLLGRPIVGIPDIGAIEITGEASGAF